MQNPLSDFERWWLDFGRFLPPLDRLTNQTGVVEGQFKAFAQEIVRQCGVVRAGELKLEYEMGYDDGFIEGRKKQK